MHDVNAKIFVIQFILLALYFPKSIEKRNSLRIDLEHLCHLVLKMLLQSYVHTVMQSTIRSYSSQTVPLRSFKTLQKSCVVFPQWFLNRSINTRIF